jgi:hypothetical protein
MATPRGSHLIDCGVAARWEETNLDAAFRSYWPQDDKRDRYEPLNDDEARPDCPHPYCVYEREPPIDKGHSTGGTPATEYRYLDVPILFRIHAKASGSDSAESVAETVAMLVKRAFDPGTPLLGIAPDRHLGTIAEEDWTLREGDQEWMYVVRYLIKTESDYGRGEQNALPSYIDLSQSNETSQPVPE